MPADSSTPAPDARAVFLSYAREDTGAARRIADALRGFGIQVWFDQHELRGGDAWDAKIRHQIRACALFVPVISASTQARSEGYFRREWKIAVDRTHDMHEAVAFIVPVVVDDTAESTALVPEPFLRVQWTRLPGGEPNPQFVEQVKRLLEPRPKAVANEAGPAPRAPVGDAPPPAAPESDSSLDPQLPAWMWVAFAVLVLGIAAGWYFLHKRAIPAPEAKAAAMPAESRPGPAAPSPGGKSIAVLPFANFSPDKDNEFFADGMHDEVITALAKIHDLTVISRTSVMAYKNPEGRNLKKIAAELGVANVLEGSVQRAGNRAKVIVQLIDARTDQHLWAETYTEDVTDVFTIQSKLAGAITTALKATLSPAEKSLIERRPTQDPVAYDFYLQGKVLAENLTPRSARVRYDEAIALFEQAVAQDPKFTLAYAWLTRVNGLMYWFGTLDPTPERKARALAALEKAERLDPNAPETHLARGAGAYFFDNDWTRALAEYHGAEAGLPNDPQLLALIGYTHRRLGNWQEAVDYLERAVALNPHDLYDGNQLCLFLLSLRRYGRALELAQHYAALLPGDGFLQDALIHARYDLDGDRPAMLRALAARAHFDSDPEGLNAAYDLAMLAGDFTAAERVLADPRLKLLPQMGGLSLESTALHRAQLAWLRGQRELAGQFAEMAIAELAARRSTPRQEMVEKMMLARAKVFGGRGEEAMREGGAAAEGGLSQDAYYGVEMKSQLGRIYVVCDRREEALAVLREIMALPLQASPNDLRLDPLWSRLKDDPRFEEILKSAKPL